MLPVPLALGLGAALRVPVPLCDPLRLAECVGEGDPVDVPDGVDAGLTEAEGVPDSDADARELGVAEPLPLGA
jgi:hypothetical protein